MKNLLKRMSDGRGEGGFTLIEVMAAALVLAVGLLAIAAMQDIALSRNVDANELSLITNLTADMTERMRYNAVNLTAYNGIDTLNAGTRPPISQPMARGDYDQWSARLAASGLQGVQGRVTVTASGPAALNQSTVAVQVTWTGRGNLGTGGAAGMGNTGGKLWRPRALILNTIIVPDK
jgi:type IV pilus assembly protein PilV